MTDGDDDIPGPQSVEDAVAKRLELAYRTGQLARQGLVLVLDHCTGHVRVEQRPCGCDYVATHAKRVARPLTLKLVVDDVAALLRGDRVRAVKLVDAEFVRGWSKRHLDTVGWTKPLLTEEERHLWTLLSTGPTSVDDRGTRKKRQRAVDWFRRQGRVIEDD